MHIYMYSVEPIDPTFFQFIIPGLVIPSSRVSHPLKNMPQVNKHLAFYAKQVLYKSGSGVMLAVLGGLQGE